MTTLTTGQLADEVGVGVETIRFYERRGLLEEPPRKPSGYRQYSPAAIRRLQFIRRAKELGFTLAEIQELLDLNEQAGSACAEVQSQIAAKLADVNQRITSLEQLRQGLEDFDKSCRQEGSEQCCPFLDSLQGDWQGEIPEADA